MVDIVMYVLTLLIQNYIRN